MNLSIILLTHNSEKDKGFCLKHCLFSLLNQDFQNFEIILVNNVYEENTATLNFFDEVSKFSVEDGLLISLKYVFTKTKLTRGEARTLGASMAESNLLVFIDDDAILIDQKSLKKVHDASKNHLWGLGANRLWTRKDWFNRNSEEILKKIKQKDYSELKLNSADPPKFIRGNENIEPEKVSFIGHFGFCDKTLFNSVGGFPDFEFDSFEDDFLSLMLYRKAGKPFILSAIDIVHVNHSITLEKQKAFLLYFSRLIKKDIFDFDCLDLIAGKDKPIKSLNSIHYAEELEKAYNIYRDSLPLNFTSMEASEIENWRSKFRLSDFDFAFLVSRLLCSKSIDDFIQNNAVDFDNIAPLIKAAVKSKLANIDHQNQITSNYEFVHYKLDLSESSDQRLFKPNSEFNQFPCTLDSRRRRLDFIKSRFPYCEFVRISLIGDDDLFSAELKNEFWIYPVIYDADMTVLDMVRQFSDRFVTKNIDFCSLLSEKNHFELNEIPKSYTFITDPPYTLNGILLFILTGLLTLDLRVTGKREFYVIINPSIIGKKIYSLLKILSRCNIFLLETISNFNSYNLPFHYGEYERAKNFATENSYKVPVMSSTSNLYIFHTENPDITELQRTINEALIYKHYH